MSVRCSSFDAPREKFIIWLLLLSWHFNKNFAYRTQSLVTISRLKCALNCAWHRENQTNGESHLETLFFLFRKSPTQIEIIIGNTSGTLSHRCQKCRDSGMNCTINKINFILLFQFSWEFMLLLMHERRVTSNSMFFIQISIFAYLLETLNFNWFSCPNTYCILYTTHYTLYTRVILHRQLLIDSHLCCCILQLCYLVTSGQTLVIYLILKERFHPFEYPTITGYSRIWKTL